MKWILAILVMLLICCCSIFILVTLIGGIGLFNIGEADQTPINPIVDIELPSNTDVINPKAYETEETLSLMTVPENDPLELASRLLGKNNIPRTLETNPVQYDIGMAEDFWVTNTDTNLSSTVNAVLEYKTESVYFWVDQNIRLSVDDKASIKNLVDTFESQIIPKNRQFFGTEWTPGVDNDEHLFILYAKGLGNSIAGYFSSTDSIHPLAHEYSNAHEMFMLSADNTELDEAFTYGVLAHEYQHMIHWNGDRNEESWLNEGFSELAAFLNSYYLGGFDYYFINDPDIQLTDWPNDQYKTTPHYGASFLFLNYFLNRFGDEATQALVSNDENGMDSVDIVLNDLEIVDQISNEKITANDVFADWVVASYLKDESIGDGRYTYNNYPDAPRASPTEKINKCPVDWQERTVNQYGVDYLQFDCNGDFTLKLKGNPEVKVLPEDSQAGDYGFWSNKGDESDMTLTKMFDFSNVDGPITYRYKTWYDLEKDYDYLYLLVSENGEDWTILTTPSGTPEDPSGNSFGWGYNGESGGWITEEIDLSRFAGKKLYIRYEYITDAAVNGEGFYLNDIEIPEIGYTENFENGDGEWQAEGFVNIYNRIPQSFIISVIYEGDQTEVTRYQMAAGEQLEIPLTFGGDIKNIILAVSGTTRHTRTPATYYFRVE